MRKIRFAYWEDLPEMENILRLVFGTNENEIRTWRNGIEGNLPLMLVYIEENRIVGFAGLQFHTENDIIFHTDCVEPDSQRKGIGSLLYHARVALLDSNDAPYSAGVVVAPEGRAFYENLGFELISAMDYDPYSKMEIGKMMKSISSDEISFSESIMDTTNGLAFAIDEDPTASNA